MATNDRSINIDELFDDERSEQDASDTRTGVPTGVLDVTVVHGTDPSEAIELDLDSVTFSLKPDEDGDFEIHLEATVHNRIQTAVELRDLWVVLRSASGMLLESQSIWISTKFSKTQELVLNVNFSLSPVDQVRRIELSVSVEYPFQALIATAEASPLPLEGRNPQRQVWPTRLEQVEAPGPGFPQFDLELTLGSGISYRDPIVSCACRLTELSPSSSLGRETVIALRDESDQLIAKESVHFSLPAVGYPAYETVRFRDLPRAILAKVVRVDVAAKGEVQRVLHLGSFDIRG